MSGNPEASGANAHPEQASQTPVSHTTATAAMQAALGAQALQSLQYLEYELATEDLHG